jgi:hypothetical protein
MEFVMKTLFPVIATAALMLGGASAAAGDLPTYELMGFPITPHQTSVVESANVRERSPSSSPTMAGMPASPHQMLVLTPRSGRPEQKTAHIPSAKVPVASVAEPFSATRADADRLKSR